MPQSNGRNWQTYGNGIINKPTPQGLSFRDMVRAHYAACGYNEKSHTTARTNMLRWKHVGKHPETLDEMVSIVDEEYMKRDLMLSFFTKCVVWVKESLNSLLYSKTFWSFCGVGVLSVVGVAVWKRKTSVRTATALLGVGFVGQYWYGKLSTAQPVKTTKIFRMRDYCTGTTETNAPNVDQGAGYKIPGPDSQVCASKTVPIGFTFGYDYVWCPRSCIHNELNALVTRQLQPRIPVTQSGLAALRQGRRCVQQFLSRTNINVPRADWTRLFLSKYPLARRAQILKSMTNEIVVSPDVAGFPKIEIMTGKSIAKRKVRFISGFSDGYLGETGPEYYMWQKEMIKTIWGNSVAPLSEKFVYTGGMTGDQIGAWFQRYKDLGWTILTLDASKFDSRNKKEVLTEVYRVYERHLSKELYTWLHASFDKKGKTKLGIVFNVVATVASGRIDTSFGNTLIVFILLCAILILLDRSYLDEAAFSALGDDNNTALSEFHHTLDDIKSASGELGHEFDGCIVRPQEYHKLEYCSQWVWQVDHNVSVMGPKIGRLLSKTFVCHKSVPDEHMVAHTKAVLIGFKNYRWLPVFRAVYARFMEVHSAVQERRHYGQDNPYRIELKTEIDVDENVVHQHFYTIYGFDPTELEKLILNLDFNMGDCYSHPLIERMLEVDGVAYPFSFEDLWDWFTRRVSATNQRLNHWLGDRKSVV